jgi:hypothetical protein
MGDAAERQHRRRRGRRLKLSGEERPAAVDLGAERPVLRRHATHRIGDPAVDQLETVAWIGAVAAAREAEAQQVVVEDQAGVVARERPPGAVGAAQTRSEADDQQTRRRRAERGDRRVVPIREQGTVSGAKRREARTERAVPWRGRPRTRRDRPAARRDDAQAGW